MDFQKFADSVFSPTCVLSVQKTETGGYGDIRIVAANKKYADLLNLRMKPNISGARCLLKRVQMKRSLSAVSKQWKISTGASRCQQISANSESNRQRRSSWIWLTSVQSA